MNGSYTLFRRAMCCYQMSCVTVICRVIYYVWPTIEFLRYKIKLSLFMKLLKRSFQGILILPPNKIKAIIVLTGECETFLQSDKKIWILVILTWYFNTFWNLTTLTRFYQEDHSSMLKLKVKYNLLTKPSSLECRLWPKNIRFE